MLQFHGRHLSCIRRYELQQVGSHLPQLNTNVYNICNLLFSSQSLRWGATHICQKLPKEIVSDRLKFCYFLYFPRGLGQNFASTCFLPSQLYLQCIMCIMCSTYLGKGRVAVNNIVAHLNSLDHHFTPESASDCKYTIIKNQYQNLQHFGYNAK